MQYSLDGHIKMLACLVKNIIKNLPEDMQKQVYAILAASLTFSSKAEAKKYVLNELGKYGIVMQMVIEAYDSRFGWEALNDVLDRLFGKAKQSADVTHHGDNINIIVNSTEEKEKIESMGDLDI